MNPWLVIVNTLSTLNPSQTTVGLIQRIAARGYPVGIVPADGLDTLPDGSVRARVRLVTPDDAQDPQELVTAIRATPPESVSAFDAGLVLIRTNPGRGAAPVHALLLDQLAAVQDAGVPVVNNPRGLVEARTKLYLSRLPEGTRPRTLVTRNADAARSFIAQLDGPAVLKPVVGTRGKDVFLVHSADDPNLNQVLAVLFRSGFAMVQAFVPEAAAGDTRLLLLDGEILEQDGHIAAVRRVPGGSDFRSNVHVGATAQPATLSPRLERLAKAVGPRLRADGLFLVGLDVIGDVVVEVNVFSPGGFADAQAFTGIDFLQHVVDALEARASA